MFDNIGGKIKGLAKFVTWVGIITSVIAGIAMISSGGGYYRYENPMVLPGLAVIVFGSLGAWTGSFLLYGFGELIEQAISINSSLHIIKYAVQPKEVPAGSPKKDTFIPKERAQKTETAANAQPQETEKKPITPEPGRTDSINTRTDTSSMSGGKISDEENKVAIVDRSKSSIICPFCNVPQSSHRDKCMVCSTKFVDADDASNLL